MKTVRIFNSESESALQLKITFNGVMNLVYVLRLFDVDGNTEINRIEGNNELTSKFTFDLPNPAIKNNGRTMILKCKFRGLDNINFPKFIIFAQMYQNGLIIGTDIRSGELTGEYQNFSITLKIKL